MTFRFIDDTLSVDNPQWDAATSKPYETGGLYPSALVLNDTTITPQKVNFLGMCIVDVSGDLSISVFDKRREFPFKVCRYPHKRSLIPEYIAYGVFTGLLHRYYRICTHFQDFLFNAALLARTMVKQGWHLPRLYTAFRRFLSSRPLGRNRWRVPLKRACAAFTSKTDRIGH
jgi:hypothetical protein